MTPQTQALFPAARILRVLWSLRGWEPPDELDIAKFVDFRTGSVTVLLSTSLAHGSLTIEPRQPLGSKLWKALQSLSDAMLQRHDACRAAVEANGGISDIASSRVMRRASEEFETNVARVARGRLAIYREDQPCG